MDPLILQKDIPELIMGNRAIKCIHSVKGRCFPWCQPHNGTPGNPRVHQWFPIEKRSEIPASSMQGAETLYIPAGDHSSAARAPLEPGPGEGRGFPGLLPVPADALPRPLPDGAVSRRSIRVKFATKTMTGARHQSWSRPGDREGAGQGKGGHSPVRIPGIRDTTAGVPFRAPGGGAS